MGRYVGTLHKLVGGAHKRSHWAQVLSFLEGHSVANDDATAPNFDSPLPPCTAPSDDLVRALLDGQGPKLEDTPLRIACTTAPSYIIAALCHLEPQAARMADSKGRLPLHWACQNRPTAEKDHEKAIRILLHVYPEALVHRDECGRTPLHYLFWYHGNTRSAKLTEVFCQPLPAKAFVGVTQFPSDDRHAPLPDIPGAGSEQPRSVVMIPDANHGALPLHYAVMGGATKDVVKVLLLAYPESKVTVDRHGRTPLAWYLGAGSLTEPALHISGEALDPNAPAIYETHISANMVHALLSAKVARTTDDTGRYPFHWAIHLLACHYFQRSILASGQEEEEDIPAAPECLSMRALQMVLDKHAEVLTLPDGEGLTPLHILFTAVAEQQNREWKRLCRNHTVRDKVDLIEGGGPGVFEPPLALVQLLLQSPGAAPNSQMVHSVGERPACAAHVEDPYGRLPLHCALLVATEAKVVKVLVQANLLGLVHTTEETLQTPLHMLLSSPFATPLVTMATVHVMLEAYVTSRHGTYVDGRLALKMEDSEGKYPLHLACENLASLEVLRALLNKYPKAIRFQNGTGDLPLHALLETDMFGKTAETPGSPSRRATLAESTAWTSNAEESFRKKQQEVQQRKMKLLMAPLINDEVSLKITSSEHGMTPLHIALAFDVLSYAELFHMVSTCRKVLKMVTTVEGHQYTPLDLHEQRRSAATNEELWHSVRELLFSFHPLLDTHRRKEALLDRCAQVVRDELEGKGSFHSRAREDIENSRPTDLQLTSTLSSIEAPTHDLAVKPKTPKMSKKENRFNAMKKPVASPPSDLTNKNKKITSIYDDDLDTGFSISPTGTYDDEEDYDDDDYFTEDDRSEKEYKSDDYDSRYDDESMFDEDTKTARKESRGRDATHEKSRSTGVFGDAHTNGKVSTTDNNAPDPGTVDELSRHCELSEVAQRLWIFFVLFVNPKSPEDHYVKQVDAILWGIDIASITGITSQRLPSYASDYLEKSSRRSFSGLTVRDVANAYCQATIHRLFFFVGRYEFRVGPNESLLIHRDGEAVTLRVTEHIVTTGDSQMESPGDMEEQIWSTGADALHLHKPKASFQDTTRTVCIKFMKNEHAYKSEVECRKVLRIPVEDGQPRKNRSNIVPLINHFSAAADTVEGKWYSRDIQNDRYRTIGLDSSSPMEDGENTVVLADFPFAVVTHHRDDGDLQDYYYHHGVIGVGRARDIGTDIGRSLKVIHDHGLAHGNVSFRGVKSVLSADDVGNMRHWALSDLSCACHQTSPSYMAGISPNGTVNFSTGTLPPEMFVKLGPAELNAYSKYWDFVQSTFNLKVDNDILQPRLNKSTGDAYVVRCHFLHEKTNDVELPELPYKLVPVRQAADVWSFGQILYTLCSGGRPLFATNVRTGHLLDFCSIGSWDQDHAKALIYENVDNLLAQDILLHLLSPYEDRAELNMERVLGHPFFSKDGSSRVEKLTKRIVEKRAHDSLAQRKAEEQKFKALRDDSWLSERTKKIECWDLTFQQRLQMSPSELIKKEFSSGRQLTEVPVSFIIIPYKLSRNKAGKLTPSTKGDVEKAEGTGMKLLALWKACHYAVLVEDAVSQKDTSFRWSSKDLLQALRLPEQFRTLDEEMIRLAATEIEQFRENPMVAARLVIQERVNDLAAYFEDAQRAFLYLVDEKEGVPVIDDRNDVYPIEIEEGVADFVKSAIPLMHLCSLYMQGSEGGIAGLVKLIFEGAHPLVPRSWAEASSGLTHGLNEAQIRREARILRDAISNINGADSPGVADAQYFQDLFRKADPERSFCSLKRVTNGEASLWTSDRGVEKIELYVKEHDLAEALREKEEAQKKIEEQALLIVELEKRLEDLEFHKKLNISEFSPDRPVDATT